MFQVVHSEKPLYVQAGNCVEASEWLEILGQVSRCNEARLATFHPSNYASGAWQCCRIQNNSAPGCKPCTAWVFTHIANIWKWSGSSKVVAVTLPKFGHCCFETLLVLNSTENLDTYFRLKLWVRKTALLCRKWSVSSRNQFNLLFHPCMYSEIYGRMSQTELSWKVDGRGLWIGTFFSPVFHPVTGEL